jgi:hypothetical protein
MKATTWMTITCAGAAATAPTLATDELDDDCAKRQENEVHAISRNKIRARTLEDDDFLLF